MAMTLAGHGCHEVAPARCGSGSGPRESPCRRRWLLNHGLGGL